VNVNLQFPVFTDDLHAFTDMPYPPLAENINFFKSDRFGHVHVPLGSLKPLGGHIQCRIIIDRFLRDQDPSGMNTPVVGKIFHQGADMEYPTGEVTLVEVVFRLIYQHVNFIFGQPIDLAQFPQGRPSLKRGDCSQQCRVL